jgi:hypothetical protein
MPFEIKEKLVALLMMFLMIVLLFTWFFPTINGAQGINNTTTLWLGGTNYNWFVPVLIVVIIIIIVLWFLGLI